MKVINLFAGPGAGKSTTAAGLFFLMKSRGHKVELVTEYAKELTYEKDWGRLGEQLVVTAEQYYRQARLKGQVDWVITDTPILLGAIYGSRHWEREAAKAAFNEFDNLSFVINRVKPYQPYGRRQSEASARHIDSTTKELLKELGVEATDVDGDETAPEVIYNRVFSVPTPDIPVGYLMTYTADREPPEGWVWFDRPEPPYTMAMPLGIIQKVR